VTVQTIERVCDPGASDGLSASAGVHDAVAQDSIVDVVIRARDLIALDAYADHGSAGRFALVDRDRVVAGGLISMKGFADQRPSATPKSAHIYQAKALVSPAMRAARNGHGGAVIWLTGLSGAGKSTIANLVEKRLHAEGRRTYLLDGDNVRHGLNKDLGFTEQDRVENIRRVAEVARLMVDAGLIVLVSFISPFRAERQAARALLAEGEFIEVFVDAPLAEVERRDPKGLYRRARSGQLKNFTGIDSPYEPPETPEIHLDMARLTLDEAVQVVVEHMQRRQARGWP
jgi:bifunctional enzyme CysN/CysC